jgi:hypothetical protein
VNVEGTADAAVNGNVVMGQRHFSFASLNLNGGRFAANALTRATGTNTPTFVQYNGGTFVANASGLMFSGVDDAHPMTLIAHGGGAAIEVAADATALFNLPLGAASGKVLTAVSLANAGSGYIAPPAVTLTGGGGTGATAVAEIDRSTGKITALRVTSGGSATPPPQASRSRAEAARTRQPLPLSPNRPLTAASKRPGPARCA